MDKQTIIIAILGAGIVVLFWFMASVIKFIHEMNKIIRGEGIEEEEEESQ